MELLFAVNKVSGVEYSHRLVAVTKVFYHGRIKIANVFRQVFINTFLI